MVKEDGLITLAGMENLFTHEAMDAYRVNSGTVLVYIVPWTRGVPGRRLLLCEVTEGRVIPSFAYRDRDYREWRFSLVAQDKAVLAHMPYSVTSVLQRNFLKRIKIGALGEESFEDSLVEFYQKELVKDDVFIGRSEKHGPAVNIASYGVIREAFIDHQDHISGNDPVYRAVAYACTYLSHPVAAFEKVTAYCGKRIDVPDIARASRLICREVVLESNWYRKDTGVIIGTIGKRPVACIPKGTAGYCIYDPETGKPAKLTPAIAQTIDPKAYVLGRTFPGKKLITADLIRFGQKSISKSDLTAMLLLGLFATLIGILLPTLNQQIYDNYIPLGNIGQLAQICIVVGSFMIGNLFFNVVKNLTEFRSQSRIGYDIQNAVYDRIFHLPEGFFRKYDSADLAQRVTLLGQIINQFVNVVLITGLSTLFSLLYLVRMYLYSSTLTWVSLAMTVLYAAALAFISRYVIKYEQQGSESKGKASSKLYQYLNGIEKIRMAGVEDQAIYEYLVPFSGAQAAEVKKNRFSAVSMVLSGVSMTIFSMVLYFILINMRLDISMGAFIGFNAALGTFSSAALQMVDSVMGIYQMKPMYERFKTVLETQPEDQEESELPGKLSGNIELDHITFSYGKDFPLVLNDINLQIKAGEYVGIVGASGCGKSTLLKLLLGFETPSTGSIRYDGKSLATMDKHAFRQNLGVVLQNGRLIAGSIYENITITAPDATMGDVQRVIEAVGLKEDIAQMPMGIHTVLSENSSTISGGQQQRILIARAIIRNPSILLFDEATSALDNVTQAAVCDSLDRMDVTRIVVAHRLSTIRTCDRIIVLQNGHIAEEGNYDALMRKQGLFYQLASRQIAE